MADHYSKKSEPLIKLPDVEKLKEEIKSAVYELRNGKVWFSEEIKREHRRLKTSLVRYFLQSRFFAMPSHIGKKSIICEMTLRI